MVTLNKIYTRTGDDGTTALGDGSRVAKTHVLPESCGAVDEANCAIGVAVTTVPALYVPLLQQWQNDLFDVGADLCVPYKPNDNGLRITQAYIDDLEQHIDRLNAPLEPLRSFILPGGQAAQLHVARAAVRRAERVMVHAAAVVAVNPLAVKYVNRLSDALFVLCRVVNNGQDPLWQPAKRNTAS
jgi:cob(I)alamin adenosyltransferase